jgi:hypothetical protein
VLDVTNADQFQVQEDLHQFEKWEKTWQMSFNADKCFTLHTTKKRKPTEYNYSLHNQVLEVTKDSKYLSVITSNDKNSNHLLKMAYVFNLFNVLYI